jgi:hypothetical protein
MAPRGASDPMKSLPEAFKAWLDGWNNVTQHNHEYTVVYADDFFNENLGKKLRETLTHFENSLNCELASRGKNVTSVNTFEFLVGEHSFNTLVDYTTQCLIKRNKHATNPNEFREFIATRILRSRLRVSSKRAFELLDFTAIQNGFICMSQERYTDIMSCIRGYDVLRRVGSDEDEFWLRQDNLMPHLHPLEVSMFQNSVKTLLNRESGYLVIDDELVASRASDVKLKS